MVGLLEVADRQHPKLVFQEHSKSDLRCEIWYTLKIVTVMETMRTDFSVGTTHLNAEILWSIKDEYPTNNPFDAPFDEMVDLVVLIYLTHITPLAVGVDGYPDVYLNLSGMQSNSDYFDDLTETENFGLLSGTSQIQSTVGYIPPSEPGTRAIASAYPVLHETFHGFGLGDGPPHQAFIIEGHPERKYYYGYLNLMSQHLATENDDGLQGVPGLGLPWLERMGDDGWVDVEDFTGMNFKKRKIYDIRAFNDPNNSESPLPEETGKIYKFNRTQGPPTGEFFLISFHGGIGIDSQDDDGDEIPMVRSKGLEIYHCTGTGDTQIMFDIESSFGMFTDISATSLPEDFDGLDRLTFLSTWGTEDRESGKDNYDFWLSNGSERTDMETHPGHFFDFFSKNLGAYSQWEKPEFSFNSNPHCYWYEDHSVPTGEGFFMMRNNPQNVPNSMVIRIHEQHNDADPPYAIVDFLSAPYEDLLSPGQTAHEFYQFGEPLEITWADYYGDDITKVEISYSTDGGDSFQAISTICIPPATHRPFQA